MPEIPRDTRCVYHSPTKGRDYLTLRAACDAEARAQMDKKHPREREQIDFRTGACIDSGWHWSGDAHLVKVYERLARLIRRASKQSKEKP